ncbi:MAG: hypothetical protein SXV54_13810, partial [Chloroflexota bacterium]|nr:hypothetical protein [Chloroflexota bacterium]
LVHITETVPVGTVLTNTAHITSTNPDYNPANDIDTDGTTVISPTRDMHVEKIVYSTDEAAPGAKFRYRIRVWNQGNATAHDVVLTDTLPISTSYVSWSAYSRSESHYIFGREVVESVSNNQVVWDLGSIEASHSDYIYLTVHVSDTVAVGAVLTNTVEVSTSNMDEDPSDDLVELATTVVPPAWDMAVDYKELSWSSDVPLVGGNEIEYYIEFSNYGNMAARDVIITDDLPANVTFVSWYGEAEDPDVDLDETITWTVSNNQVVWYLGEVAAGQYGYIYPTVQVMNTAMARDVLCNRVQISTSDMDEEPFNDVYTHTVTVYVPTWDVYVSKYLNSLAGAPGGEMEYEIYFGNEGHATARDVVVTDTLPANTTFVDWRGYVHNPYISEWDDTITPEVIGNQVVWHLGEVEAGQYGYIYPTVRIADGVNIGDVLTNVVEISTSDDDWDWTDDSYVLTTTVSPPVVDLDIYKYTACTGAPDGAMEYSISVENYGNVAASDVVITDTFPVSTTFLSWLGYSYDPSLDLDQMITPTVNGNQVVWHIGTVSVGQSIHLQPLVHVSDLVNVGDELVNVARVSTSDVDIETSNNVATETTTIVSPTVDVTISKYAYLAVPGGIMEYWIDFYNGGSITAPDVVITDTLPMSTSFDSWTGSFSSSSTNLHDVISPTVSGDQVIWHLGAVTGCTSGHIYMNVYISDTVQVGDVLTNVIEISTTGDDDNIENNIYTSTAIVEALYALTGVTVTGPVTGLVDTSYTFTATVSPPTATTPIRYEWQTTDGQSSETTKGGSYNKVHFTWAATGTKTIVVTATNAGGPVTATHTITISAPPPCYELTGVEIVGPTAGYEDTSYTFTSVITPSNATEPINYTWTSSPPGTLAMPGQPSAAFTWPATGTKTIQLTAENCEGVTVTDTHTIELAAMEQVSVTVEPGTGVTLVYTDPQGLPTTVEVPAGAVTDTTTIVYTPVPSPTESITTGLRFANHAFDLEAYRNDVLLPDFTFEQPVTVTVHYSDDDVAGLDEDTLTLYYWDGSAWVDAATTCDPDSIYDRHPLDNWFAVSICHLTRWGAYGTEISQYPIFLPIVLKNH